jgi:hypothetical protein
MGRHRQPDREPVGTPSAPELSEDAKVAVSPAELPDNFLELYKLAVEMADRVSARRGIANSFFLTANTGVAALLGNQHVRWYLPVAGIVFSTTWWALLKSYRDLNAAKFAVILGMEERLPVRVYGDEWDRLRQVPVRFGLRRDALRAWLGQYRELGRVERIVPWVFVVIYVAEILRQLIG